MSTRERVIVVEEKREVVTLPCCNCGKPVRVMIPYEGDVLCEECMGSGPMYVLRKVEAAVT